MRGFVKIAAAFSFALVGGLGASLTSANADVIRIAVVSADSKADFDNNAALVATFEALLRKGAGVKGVYAGTDAEKMSITTTSVWGSASDVAAVTDSADWKAAAGKLKAKTYTTEIFELAP
jgi:hypothetical protein